MVGFPHENHKWTKRAVPRIYKMSENEEIFEAEEPVLSVTEFVQDLDQVVKEKILEVKSFIFFQDKN